MAVSTSTTCAMSSTCGPADTTTPSSSASTAPDSGCVVVGTPEPVDAESVESGAVSGVVASGVVVSGSVVVEPGGRMASVSIAASGSTADTDSIGAEQRFEAGRIDDERLLDRDRQHVLDRNRERFGIGRIEGLVERPALRPRIRPLRRH